MRDDSANIMAQARRNTIRQLDIGFLLDNANPSNNQHLQDLRASFRLAYYEKLDAAMLGKNYCDSLYPSLAALEKPLSGMTMV